MSNLLSGLNPPQQEAVRTVSGPLLVLAGAGTGKTRVITHRMAYLIQQGVPPANILALTFTNKAAREMKERFIALIKDEHDPKSMKVLFAGTFHSFCVHLLREFIEKLDYGKNFTIYDEADQIALMKQVIARVAGADSGIDAGKIKFLIGLAKNKGYEPSADRDGPLAPQIFRRYQEELKLRNAVDFDDLLLLAARLMKEHPDVHEKLCQRYRYLLVDEYQDTNQIQFEIVRLLASEGKNVCVVGDDDQSIYSWRGAESTHILEFEDYFPKAKVVKLEQNYRCTPNILKAANHIIKNNSRRHQKSLWAAGADGEKIYLVNSAGEQQEAAWVVSEILNRRQMESLSWENFAILYRANHLSRAFEYELGKFRIPYRVVGGLGFYERREVKDVIAYLQVIMNPGDDISLLRVINQPARGIGKITLEELMRGARAARHSVWDEVQLHRQRNDGRTQVGLEKFVSLIHRYHIRFQQEPTWSQTMKDLLEELGYFEDIRRTSKNGSEASNRCENVQEFVSSLAAYEQQHEGDLQDFIDNLRLEQKEDKHEEQDGHGVTLMTLHAAKGLEFRRVFLVGLEENILPHERSKLENNIEEERRLFYVGMTRAMKGLALSYCDTRIRYGKQEPCVPSSFLNELPPDVLEPISASSTLTMTAPEHVVNRLSALRARLGKI
ncbi:MAG: UvrD-helicase domain-containing protein [Verrucomicrobiales bacterium]|jgi:superfamily I DNA/RNA helicase|nr:UvrD-helicase domain-containing protein [Verrucomicrobiales bacterium]